MTPERFQQIDRLLDLALEHEPAQRPAFLDNACAGDAGLRNAVESLLLSHDQASGFLAKPPSDLANDILAARDRKNAADDLPGTLNKVLGRYVVSQRLGHGGMGVVYAAYDPELDRKIAIKLISPVLSDSAPASEGRARLLREAQAMARLSHPNVIAVYDVGAFGDQVFIAMEYVEGITLSQWLAERKRDWREVLSILVQAGRGLAAAHAAGILHRDFKPDNVLVGDDGRARVVDFGLARAAHAAGRPDAELPDDGTGAARAVSARAGILSVAVTEPGKLMGTPAYMAPEQLMGEPVDARTDQFSFCVALYQAFYGELPFSAETVTALLDQMKHRRFQQATNGVRVPARVRKVLLCGLSRAREDRYESMDDLLRDLTRRSPPIWRWSLAAVVILAALLTIGRLVLDKSHAAPLRSIAVLPLENLSGDAQQEYLADGITDELITNLSKVASLRVIGRNSAMKYKSRPRSVREIAKDLNVDAVLEGTLLFSGDRVQIAAQLIDAATERNIWGERYEGALGDLLALQNLITRAIIAGIRVKLTRPDENRLATVPPINSEAYLAYLKGLFHWEKGWSQKEEVESAIRMFEQATALDPEFALAHARVALACSLRYLGQPSPDLATRAFAAAKTSLSLDPKLPEAYLARGRVAEEILESPQEAAIQDFKRALELNPNLPDAHFILASTYLHIGLLDQALSELKSTLQLDPYFYRARFYLARVFLYQQKFDEAFVYYQRSPEFPPNMLWEKVLLLFYRGQRMAAYELLDELQKKQPDNPDFPSAHAILLAVEGEKGQAEKEIRRAVQNGNGGRHFHHTEYNIASAYALMGNHQEALRWLRRTAEHRLTPYPLFERDPNLDNLRSDPEFKTWLGEMKSLWERRRSSL
jgi:serine/threonine protein kinase/Flp pilus assembly protein TadD